MTRRDLVELGLLQVEFAADYPPQGEPDADGLLPETDPDQVSALMADFMPWDDQEGV